MHYVPFDHKWSPKTMLEKINIQHVHIPAGPLEQRTRDAFVEMMHVLALHRPVASNGKHGNLHTETCGCEA